MKPSLLLIFSLVLLTGCIGGYNNSVCQGRVSDLANLEGNYTISGLGATINISRTGTGNYEVGLDKRVAYKLTSCMVNNIEIVELSADGVFMAFTRSGVDLTGMTFDTAVLDAEGVKYTLGESNEWPGATLVAVEDSMTDEVFMKALIPGTVTLEKQ